MTSVKRSYQKAQENMVKQIIEPIKYVPLKNSKLKETKGMKRNLHKQNKGKKRNLILKINSNRLV
jgi:hypothetical protein